MQAEEKQEKLTEVGKPKEIRITLDYTTYIRAKALHRTWGQILAKGIECFEEDHDSLIEKQQRAIKVLNEQLQDLNEKLEEANLPPPEEEINQKTQA